MHPPKAKIETSSSRKYRIQRFATGLYALLLLIGSVLPGDKLPTIPNWSTLFSPDKVMHFGAYGVFALLLSVTLSERRTNWTILSAITMAAVFGFLMEVFQAFSGTGRSFDAVDMVANLIGALIGGGGYWLYQQIKNRSSQR